MAGKKWEWECGGKIIFAERNTARDVKLCQSPREGVKKVSTLHTGEKIQVVSWQWPGDSRVFIVPAEILEILATYMTLTKDVIITAGHLYREQHYPNNRMIETSYRQLAELLGLEWAGKRLINDLSNALTLARWLTIHNHPVIRKLYPNGRVREFSRDTFGFIDRVSRIEIREGRKIPRNKQPLEIVISEMYASAIKKMPAAPVPVAAIEAAHKAPQRLRTPVKNLTYYLASRVPLERVKLSILTLADVLGYKSQRKDKLRRATDNVVNILYGIVIRDYISENDIYTFVLAGKPIKTERK